MRPADPVAQRRAAPMVLQQGPAPDAADDANERRPLQRAALPIHPVDFVLTSCKKGSSAFVTQSQNPHLPAAMPPASSPVEQRATHRTPHPPPPPSQPPNHAPSNY